MPNANGVTDMDIETLYPLVTEAIRRAEVYEELHAPGMRDAWRDVSRLEEEIAKVLPYNDLEGEVARRGAITAAISGAAFRRAIDLADRFMLECGTDSSLSRDLQALRAQAIARRPEAEGEMEVRYQRGASRWGGFGAILNFHRGFLEQGAPLPIR